MLRLYLISGQVAQGFPQPGARLGERQRARASGGSQAALAISHSKADAALRDASSREAADGLLCIGAAVEEAVTSIRLEERVIVLELMKLYVRQALAHREQAAPRWRAACAG
jgi:hypothetical protein